MIPLLTTYRAIMIVFAHKSSNRHNKLAMQRCTSHSLHVSAGASSNAAAGIFYFSCTNCFVFFTHAPSPIPLSFALPAGRNSSLRCMTCGTSLIQCLKSQLTCSVRLITPSHRDIVAITSHTARVNHFS
jgi:hypothetical protein